jgi:hypothetical protein
MRVDLSTAPTPIASQDTAAGKPTPRWWPLALAIVSAVLVGATATALIVHNPGLTRLGLVVLSSVLATASTAPAIWQTVHGQGNPRLVTWGTWALLTALAGFAAAVAGDYPAAAFSFIGTAATTSVAVAAWRFGDRAFDRIDAVCMVLVVGGCGLWLRLHQPWVAVIAACVIDCIGLVSTVRHVWSSPEEESPITYALIGVAGILAAAAAIDQAPNRGYATHLWSGHDLLSALSGLTTALGYPVYVAVSMGLVAMLCYTLLRRASRAA